jgi:hypothetical protein
MKERIRRCGTSRSTKQERKARASNPKHGICLQWKNADDFLGLTTTLELHHAVDQCEERVVTSVAPGREPRAPLPYKDAARRDFLTTEALYTQTLRVAVSTVA